MLVRVRVMLRDWVGVISGVLVMLGWGSGVMGAGVSTGVDCPGALGGGVWDNSCALELLLCVR